MSWRKLRLEKVVASKQLRLAMEMAEKRRAKLEKMVATKLLRLAMETDIERKARLEKKTKPLKSLNVHTKIQGMSSLAL